MEAYKSRVLVAEVQKVSSRSQGSEAEVRGRGSEAEFKKLESRSGAQVAEV